MTDSGPDRRADRAVVAPYRAALYDFEPARLRQALDLVLAPDAAIHLAHPFEDLTGPDELMSVGFEPLADAVPDLERRDTIVMAGRSAGGDSWVGCCGFYTGTFVRPWLGIPPTGHQVAMRHHEFFRIEGGVVVEVHALWDIPEVMVQAGVWPMARSLGREWQVPGPAPQDGLATRPPDDADRLVSDEHDRRSAASVELVERMLTDMGRHPEEPVEAMNLERYWHPRFSWYGPSGIGTGRGVDGFRRHHQIPFLNAMPDRRAFIDPTGGDPGHLFGDGDYVGFTAWPGMAMTLTGDGWLGIAPTSTELTMRSLDFWRIENGLIRENWVLVDLLHVHHQLGVDVLARMAEMIQGPPG